MSRFNEHGDVVATIDNRRVAAVRIQQDEPVSVSFFKPKTGLRVDVLFDFPIPVQELAANAKKIKVGSHILHMASPKDLLRLKKIAKSSRVKAGDADDIAFLKALRDEGGI